MPVVPPDADARAFGQFAGTFDGYAYVAARPKADPNGTDHLVRRLGLPADPALAASRRDGSLPTSLGELRACLFFEARRRHHLGSARGGCDEAENLPYVRALVEAVRRKVRGGALE